MALVSPGVEVSVVDESAYRSATTNSVPFILIATAQNKVNAAGTGVATGTTAANANNTYLITSQRELVNTFGNPFFYNTSAGTPINGYELNEYGLLAAYSVLGVSNRAYVQRVDVDLAELAASLTRPTGTPANNSYWLDTAESTWGIFEWNSTTNTFTNKVPTVITDTDDLDTGIPKESIGTIGSYAIVATNINNPMYYKNKNNEWVLVGSDDWKASIPAVIGSVASPTLTATNQASINGTNVTLTGTTVASFASDINGAAITGVTAAAVNNKLEIYVETGAGDAESSLDVSVTLAEVAGTPFADAGITAGTYYAPILRQAAHTSIPRWRSTDSTPRPSGSVWQKTSSVNNGMNLSVKQYSTTAGAFVAKSCPVHAGTNGYLKNVDPVGGGLNVATGAVFAEHDVQRNDTGTVKLHECIRDGGTVVTGNNTSPAFTSGNTFTISSTSPNSGYSTPVTATLGGTTAADFVAAVLAADVEYVSARVLSTGAIELSHTSGGAILLQDTAGTPVTDAGFVIAVDGVETSYSEGTPDSILISKFRRLTDPDGTSYAAQGTAPGIDPTDGTLWYYSSVSDVDIMIHDGSNWKGYNNVSNDVRGFDLTDCNPTGVQVGASAPTTQSDESALVYGDLWVDTSDLENYPLIKRWESVDSVDQWVTIDNADQTTENGVIFADARWDTDGTTDPIVDSMPEISDLVTSNYLDIDAPDPALYPAGTLLFNTRRSGYNVKRFATSYYNAADFPDDTLPTEKNAWVSASGLKNDGAPYMGRQAQRAMVVAAMQAGIDSNTTIREEQRVFNLMAAPGYPELMDNMVALNNDRKNTAFIVGDTPLRLAANGTDLTDWATNNSGLGTSTGDGLNVNDNYLGVFYPAGQTNDLSGNTVVVPPSHAMLRTLIRNDAISYEWFAPAGTRRGNIDNVSQLGYVDAQSGEFVPVSVGEGIRDTLYENQVNPLTFIPGTGLVNFGNKTTKSGTAMDRINVARLVAFMRGQVDSIGKGYLFEPNDKTTRSEIKNACEQFMNDLVAKRAIYDYLVVCDETNNTPGRIDRSELYVDIAIEPVKAAEYIYIPLRIKNTGDLSAGL